MKSYRLVNLIATGLILVSFIAKAKIETPQAVTKALKDVQAEINDLQFSLKTDQKKETQFEQALKLIDTKTANIIKQLQKLTADIDMLTVKTKSLSIKRTKLEKELNSHKNNLSKILSVQYSLGKQEKARLIFNSEDMQSAKLQLTYLQYFQNARMSKIKQHKHLIAELIETENQLKSNQSLLNAKLALQKNRKKQYKSERLDRETVLTALRTTIKSTDERLKKLTNEENRLQKLFNKLKNVLSDIPKTLSTNEHFEKLKKNLGWPTKGKISVTFGSERIGKQVLWNGIIIAAKEHETVSAVHRGRVAYADWLRGFGLITIIDHSDGYMTLYAHNMSLFKEVGDWVEAGEVIATVGKTGSLDYPGLYFEIRHNGQPLNPRDWMASKWVSAK